jgi:hypothetical protein
MFDIAEKWGQKKRGLLYGSSFKQEILLQMLKGLTQLAPLDINPFS